MNDRNDSSASAMQLPSPMYLTSAVQLKNVQFHNGGFCFQNEYFTGTGTFRQRRFQAVFVTFDHPVDGQCMIDTGYGPAFLNATARLPGWVMRHLLYTPSDQPVFHRQPLASAQPPVVTAPTIFLSHYHADHIGGVTEHPASRFICRPEPLALLRQFSPWKQLHHGFLPGLLPNDFDQRVDAIDNSRFTSNPAFFDDLLTLDYWNDGSLILLDLPGHALGHTGYILNTATGPIGYIVDACWDTRQLMQGKRLPWISRQLQQDPTAYESTQQRLMALHRRTGIPLLACHCERTQAYVQHPN